MNVFDAITTVFDYRKKHGIITAADGSARQTTEQQQEIRNLLNLGETKMKVSMDGRIYGGSSAQHDNNEINEFHPDKNPEQIPAKTLREFPTEIPEKILEKFQDRFTDLTGYVVLAEHEGTAVVATVVQSKQNQNGGILAHVCIAAEPARTKVGEIKKGDFITVPADSIYNAILVSELF